MDGGGKPGLEAGCVTKNCFEGGQNTSKYLPSLLLTPACCSGTFGFSLLGDFRASPRTQTHLCSVSGRAFAWGMGTNYQLGTGEEDDVWSPVQMTGKQLENRVVLAVSSGGQHTVLLVKDKEQS